MAFLPIATPTSFFTRRLASPTLTRLHPSVRTRSRLQCSATPPTSPKIGFIGLGVMGLPMLSNLSKAFPDLLAWNRSDKTAPLKAAFPPPSTMPRVASTPFDVIAECDIIFSMLSTPEAAQSVFFGSDSAAISAVAPGKALVDCSTLRVEDMLHMESAVLERGGRFLEAPVSGSKVPAENGQLIFLCAGDEKLYNDQFLQQAFDLMGKKAFYLGKAGNGTKMKLAVNQLMATMLAAFAETIVLTEALDLSIPDLIEVLSLGAMNNPMFSLKGPKMKHGAKGYQTNFALEHAQKDVRFAQALGDDHGISMSVSSAANEWYKAAKGLGLSGDDFSAVIESIRASAGRT